MRRRGATVPLLAVGALGALGVLALTSEYAAYVGSLAVVFALVALGFVVLTGWAGDVSLGQVVPYGLGAYGTFVLADRAGVPVALAIVGAAVLTVPFLVLSGIPVLRLRGLDLAVATFALALVFQLVVFRAISRNLAPPLAGLTDFSSSVVRVDRPVLGPVELSSNRAFFIGALAGGLVVLALVAALGRSPFGRALRALRDDPVRATTLGLPVGRYRLAAFVLAGTIAALAGGMVASFRQAVTPETFTIFDSLNFLALAVIGGITTPVGAVLGGLVGAGMPELARIDPFRFLQGRLILVYGAALLLLTLRGGGVAGLLGLDRRPRLVLPEPAPAPVPAGRRRRYSLLRVDGLVVAFGGVRAVDGVSLRVEETEAVALIGPNGAGKSTCFDAVSGTLRPEAGRVFFAGADVTGLAPERRAAAGLGRTFQAARTFGGLTVAENLVAAAHLQTSEHAAATASRLLERLSLTEAAEVRPADLPFGSLRALEVGLALAARPRLLLLDEPTAGMDPDEADGLCDLLDELRGELGMAVLLVEHDMAVVGRLAQRVVVLDRGRVLAEGTPKEVAADPAVVAAYLGTSSASLDPAAALVVGGGGACS
jgi:branched-chain amino acid transport system permease protein